MKKIHKIAIFEGQQIRRHWDAEKELWYFSIVDVIAALTAQPDHKRAQSYWTTLKSRLKQEGSEVVTKCDQLKMQASDGKYYLTDAADTETMLRLIQSIPSPNAEPFKLWLARVGYERLEETADPELAINRALKTYLQKGIFLFSALFAKQNRRRKTFPRRSAAWIGHQAQSDLAIT